MRIGDRRKALADRIKEAFEARKLVEEEAGDSVDESVDEVVDDPEGLPEVDEWVPEAPLSSLIRLRVRIGDRILVYRCIV